MKKRIFAILLSALLVANLGACNQAAENVTVAPENATTDQTPNESVTENDPSTDDEKKDSNDHENTDTSKENDTQNNNQDNKDQPPNISLEELQKQADCYITLKLVSYLDYFQSKNQVFGEINCKQVENTPNVFHITTVKNNTEYKATITLSNNININAIHDGFISEEIGYIFIFSGPTMGRAVDEYIRLACLLKTNDGGKTWSQTEYQDFVITNHRQHITDACFFTEQVGFFTARYYNTDQFEGRTFWTTDGGKTWERMSLLPKPDIMAALGLPGRYFATELSDVKYLNGTYLITVRFCIGESYLIDGYQHTICIQYSSTDLKNWTLVT